MSRMEQLIRCLVSPTTALEQALQDLFVMRQLDTALGVSLNSLGKLVGRERAGLDDDSYRRIVRAQVIVNRSSGTTEELITVARAIVNDDDATIEIDPQPPASVVVRVIGTVVDDDLAALLIDMLRPTASAGVRLQLHTLQAIEAGTFAFLDSPDGLGLDDNDAPGFGGAFSTVQE